MNISPLPNDSIDKCELFWIHLDTYHLDTEQIKNMSIINCICLSACINQLRIIHYERNAWLVQRHHFACRSSHMRCGCVDDDDDAYLVSRWSSTFVCQHLNVLLWKKNSFSAQKSHKTFKAEKSAWQMKSGDKKKKLYMKEHTRYMAIKVIRLLKGSREKTKRMN